MNQPDTPPEDPVFREPWEAQSFAMAIELHRRGAFAWSEFAAALSAELLGAGETQDGKDYYRHWLSALEKLLITKSALTEEEWAARHDAWEQAAKTTPHGEPVLLK